MYLKKIILKNFRCFEELEIDFKEKLTVIIAENGLGKTAILDAIAIALGPFIGGFDTGVAKNFKHRDARLYVKNGVHHPLEDAYQRMEAGYPIILQATGTIEGKLIQWSRELTGKKTQTTFGKAKVLIEYAKHYQERVRAGKPLNLPLVAYYGTGRLWKQSKAGNNRSVDSFSRLYGYHDALNSESTYQAFAKWFAEESIVEDRFSYRKLKEEYAKLLADKESTDLTEIILNRSTILEHVRKAVDQCLAVSGWKALEYDPEWRELVVRQNLPARDSTIWTKDNDERHTQIHHELQPLEPFVPVSSLSDGVKAMLSLTADIAYRCVKLNPDLISPTAETEGIVLIDEVDLHLHPKWQQTVLSDLIKTFPKIQFIVTTHSPQVLSTIHKGSIRLLGKDNNGKDIAAMPIAESYGEISSDVLESIMHVNPMPPISERESLERLTELVDQGLYADHEAIEILENLRSVFDETHPQLQKLMRSINRQKTLRS